MKNLYKLIYTTLLLLLSFSPVHSQNQKAPSENEATAIVLEYLDALSQGDTISIKQLLGGKFLAQRQSLLENPSYSSTLSNLYSNASSKVIATEKVNDETVAVDAVVELSKDEILQCRFIITRDENLQLKIIEEREHNKTR